MQDFKLILPIVKEAKDIIISLSLDSHILKRNVVLEKGVDVETLPPLPP